MGNKYQRPVRLSVHSVSYSQSWNGYYGAGDCNRLTDSVLARSPASRSHMSAACVSIVPSVTSSSRLNFVTSASYPKVRIRAFGRSSGRSCSGQRTPCFAHVVRRLPNSPWINTTLVRNQLGGSPVVKGEIRALYSPPWVCRARRGRIPTFCGRCLD